MKIKKQLLLSIALSPVFFAGPVLAQDSFKGMEELFSVPKTYTAPFATTAPVIDGDVTDQAWANVPWTDDFIDIEGSKRPEPYFKTRCKMIWDKDNLYIAAVVKDTDVWAYVKKHDEVVFQDNDFEVFIDPLNTAQQYFELEVNAINTMWDLLLSKAYRNGGSGLNSWESGVKSAVKVQGTLNNPSDKDQGWTVEMAIPISSMGLKSAPVNGDFWRINFSRVQWETNKAKGKYVKKTDASGKNLPENNWVWSPQGLINMHYPERWGYLSFSTASAGDTLPTFQVPYAEKQRNYLWLVYYRQKKYLEKNGRYAGTLQDLGIEPEYTEMGRKGLLIMEATNHQFYVSTINSEQQETISLNQEGLIQVSK